MGQPGRVTGSLSRVHNGINTLTSTYEMLKRPNFGGPRTHLLASLHQSHSALAPSYCRRFREPLPGSLRPPTQTGRCFVLFCFVVAQLSDPEDPQTETKTSWPDAQSLDGSEETGGGLWHRSPARAAALPFVCMPQRFFLRGPLLKGRRRKGGTRAGPGERQVPTGPGPREVGGGRRAETGRGSRRHQRAPPALRIRSRLKSASGRRARWLRAGWVAAWGDSWAA